MFTFEAAPARFSMERISRIPSALASILVPFSLVDTANSVPSLLNRIQGEA